MSTCAAPGAAGANSSANKTLAAIEELQEMALDPTMEACCRRDVEDQIKAARVKHALQLDDRIDARRRIAAAAVRTDAAGLAEATHTVADSRAPVQQQPHAGHEHHQQQQQLQQQQVASWAQGQPDDEGELQRLRQQRLQQLQAQSAVQQEQRQEGFGVLNTVPESSVLRLCCQDPPGRGLVVLHLAVQGHEPCNALDQCLEEAAAQYRGTYFARCVVSRNSPLVAQLQLPHGLPALLVAKHCAVLGKAHIHQFGGADVWDEEVLSYLQRFKVLSTGASSSLGNSTRAKGASGHATGSSDDDSSGGSDAEDAADWQTPCEVCGRTYPHQHIRSIYSSHQPGSEEEEADE